LSTTDDLDLTSSLELILASLKQKAARCRWLESGIAITLRTGRLWDPCPVRSRRSCRASSSIIPNKPTSLGDMLSIRLDVAALGLVPLRLEKQHTWDS
jgi:hypothetical protein